MALDLDTALLEAEDFDIYDFGTKLGKNLEEIRCSLLVHEWHTIPYDSYEQREGTYDFDLFSVVTSLIIDKCPQMLKPLNSATPKIP